ncbi:hypothetical protein DVH24_005787 [Malus domestica]|uniref:threonine ammonia-lyase n=1 Tax=Malus domestica TaxID=3750 RepID=A0A498IMX3_MALDO|nr:hypothetical protein DVH24_005787 [Malus domestica]
METLCSLTPSPSSPLFRTNVRQHSSSSTSFPHLIINQSPCITTAILTNPAAEVISIKPFKLPLGPFKTTPQELKIVAPETLQYESGFLGAVPDKLVEGEGSSDDIHDAMSYLTKILTSKAYDVAIESPLDYASKLSEKLHVNIWLKREDLQPWKTVEKLGGQVVLVGDSYDEAQAYAQQRAEDEGLIFVHPFDHPDVIAGQGTIGMEILRQIQGPLHAIFVPVGGGGLIAGIASYVKRVRPEVKIIGVEVSDANAMALSIHHGQRIMLVKVGGFADGIAVKKVGEETFRLCRELIDGVVLVSRDAVCASIKDMFEEKRSILEPAGAVAIAGAEAYCKYYGLKGENVVAISSGANMNFDRLRLVSQLADVGRRREVFLATFVPEKRGSFKQFCELVGGRSSSIENEILCQFSIPARPGALLKFLDAFSPLWNISLFHYSGQGESGADALVGLHVASSEINKFKALADALGVAVCGSYLEFNNVGGFWFINYRANGQPLVPAMFIFGDSVVDAGNNNHLYTVIKANFPPYGRDFVNHKPTGRFCNGKLASDFTAENLGFTSYPPAYLSKEANGKNLLIGANFGSAGSGYYEYTAKLYDVISLNQQLEYYKEYQNKVVGIAARNKANFTSIISDAVYLVGAGSSDFLQNYYIDPLLYKVYTPNQFSDILMQAYATFIQNLYALGARRIGVTTLPPLGCLPAAITIFGSHSNECVDKVNNVAISFNNKLNATSQSLQNDLSGLKLVVLDIYQPLYDLVTKPAENGFAEARRACCGTGLVETAILCNAESVGTCANASEYVFWDGFHPSEAANQILANDLLSSGISLIS